MQSRPRNQLLSSLPPGDEEMLRPHLRTVELLDGANLAEAGKPKWSKDELETLKKISQQIDGVLSQKSKSEFVTNSVEIKKYLLDALLSREFGSENEIVYRTRFRDDIQFQAALNMLADKATYQRLLKPK